MQGSVQNEDKNLMSWQHFIDKLAEEILIVNEHFRVVLANEAIKNKFGIQSLQPYEFSCEKFLKHFCNDCKVCPVRETIEYQESNSVFFEKVEGSGYELTTINLPVSSRDKQWVMCTLQHTQVKRGTNKGQNTINDIGTWQLTLNDELKVVKANQFTFQFLGITKETLEKNKPVFTDLLTPEYKNSFLESVSTLKEGEANAQLRLLVKNRENSYYGGNVIIRLKRSDEKVFYELSISPIPYPEFGSRAYYENLRLQNFIYIIAQQIAQSGTIVEGYRQILYSLSEVLGANACGLIHFAKNEENHIEAALINGEYSHNQQIPDALKKEIWQYSKQMSNNHPFIIPDVKNDNLNFKDRLIELNIGSLLLHPLKHQSRFVGVLFIGLSHPFVWPENRIDFVKIIGSIVLQNFLQQQTRERLRRINENFVNIFDNSSDAVFIVSLSGQILEANRTSTALTGYNKNELLKKNVSEISRAEELDLAKVQYEMLQSQQMIFGTDLIPRKGESIPVETREKIIRFQGNLAILVIARDVRHRREINRMMVQTISETQDKERKRIAEGLHDDVGPLLSTLRIYTDLLRNTELTDQEIEAYSQKMNEIINQAINTVREVSRNLMPGVLNDFGLQEGISDFCNKINQTGVIRVYLSFNVDNAQIEDNLKNIIYSLVKELINNSIKHAEASEIDLNIRKVADELEVRVVDNGIGVDIEKQLAKNYKGLGLKNILSKVNASSGKVSTLDVDGFGLKILFPLHKV